VQKPGRHGGSRVPILGGCAKLAMAREPHPLRLATSSAVDAAIIIISDDFLIGQHHYGTFPHRIGLKHNEAMCLKALEAKAELK
jgi:hypothetical protein